MLRNTSILYKLHYFLFYIEKSIYHCFLTSLSLRPYIVDTCQSNFLTVIKIFELKGLV